jgi:hypothetical protein
MMVGSSGVRKAVLTCLAIYLFTVATGFSVISYHAKAILMQAQVTMDLLGTGLMLPKAPRHFLKFFFGAKKF